MCRTRERDERWFQTKLEAVRTAIDEGNESGIVKGDVFAQVRRELKLDATKLRLDTTRNVANSKRFR